jgi:hypothetical protein
MSASTRKGFTGPIGTLIGMSVAIFSYRGNVTIGLMVDTGLVSDPDEIAKGLEVELDALAHVPPARAGNGYPRASRRSTPQTVGRE